jgi:hypothetical protein
VKALMERATRRPEWRVWMESAAVRRGCGWEESSALAEVQHAMQNARIWFLFLSISFVIKLLHKLF